MRKKCSTCGAPAPDDVSRFCNRCGEPLSLTCRTCGKTATDPQSRFCERCGSPLEPAVQVSAPPVTPLKGKVCPSCGFENSAANAFFCKKCGNGLFASGPAGRPQEGAVRTGPDGRAGVRREPARSPVAAQPGPLSAPVAVRQEPVSAPGGVREVPRTRTPETPQRESYRSFRKIAPIAAGIILVVIIIAVIAVSVPGIPGGGPANATAGDATAPGLFDALPWGILPNETPAINQSTPVVTDTPLTPKVN